MIRRRLETVWTASRTVFAEPRYGVLGGVTFLGFLLLYVFTLPATFTGGRVGPVALRFLTPVLAGFAVLFAVLMAFIVPFLVYAVRHDKEVCRASTSGGVLGSVLPPLLCCSPLLPALASLFVGVFPAAFAVSGYVQGFIATHEIELLTGAAPLLAYALVMNAEQVAAT
ncbi:MAG: hypothetical protein SV186_01815 [Candidatus Nanohaloarchaea archaeon]|nr:hypothetical protein [Candidatus Nanohaloarchaea archaeon]